MSNYDATQTLHDLDGGQLVEQLSTALHECAKSACLHGAKGKNAKVTVELTMARIGDSAAQITASHKLSYKQLTSKGEISEKREGQTPLYVTRHGVQFLPDNQEDWIGRNMEETK